MSLEKFSKIWEQKIYPRWSHRHLPAGQRFLGSIKIEKEASDKLIASTGNYLRTIKPFTYQNLAEHCFDYDHHALKFFTFVISEYAYYYSQEKFWLGLCDKLNLPYSETVANTFRTVVDEGIKSLGLVTAQDGYKYVSTLWLQSGVPQQNLEHFANLVQDLATEYGWWELAHCEPKELAQELLDSCQTKYPQWRTLIHFLNTSVGKEDSIEPIAGNLVQSLATIGEHLHRENLSPEILNDDHERERILTNYCLPHHFFLRDWQAIIKVLQPQKRTSKYHQLISRKPQPLSLRLDLDSWNIKLILPAQNLWQKNWKLLENTYCFIPSMNWEGIISNQESLNIPELTQTLQRLELPCSCQLLNHHRQSIFIWHYSAINTSIDCLIFDALTGENLDLKSDTIVGVEEIICFTPTGREINYDGNVQVIDSYIPCSLEGWRGQQLRLTQSEAKIFLKNPRGDQQIIWKLQQHREITVTGLKLQGAKAIYLEIPQFWYIPHPHGTKLKFQIENLEQKRLVITDEITLAANLNWSKIALDQWLNQQGVYLIKFWNNQQFWSYRFQIQTKPSYKIQPRENPRQKIIVHQTPQDFWAEVIKLKHLWPLEKVKIFLKDSSQELTEYLQADSSGDLTINLANFYDCLTSSNYLSLEYERLGFQRQTLIQFCKEVEKFDYAFNQQGLEISGLLKAAEYQILGTNLFTAEQKIKKFSGGEQQITLDFPGGIYHLQIYSSQGFLKNLGIWGQEIPTNYEHIFNSDDRDIWREHLQKQEYYLPSGVNLQKILDYSFKRCNNKISEAVDYEYNWHLLKIKNRKIFLKNLEKTRQNKNDLIIDFYISSEKVYKDFIFVQLKDWRLANKYLQEMTFFEELLFKPLTPEQIAKSGRLSHGS